MTAGPVVRLRSVTAGHRRRFRFVPVLRDMSFTARPGEITALVGPNGVGKSTTLRLVLGVLPARSGSVEVHGIPPERYRRHHGAAFLPEHPVPLPGWTVASLVGAGVSLSGGTGGEAVLEGTGLAPLTGRRLSSLSRGEVRTALLAYALAGTPGLVLLDEPWSGLDLAARVRLRDTLLRLRARGCTTLVSSHELLEVARLADRILVLAGGTVARVVTANGMAPGTLEQIVREAAR